MSELAAQKRNHQLCKETLDRIETPFMKMQEENHELKSRADISDADCKIATIKSKLLQGQVDPLSK